MKDRIHDAANRLAPQLVELRRDFHRHPELAFEETRTAAEVARRLTELGIEHRTGIATTGVLGVIRGGKDSGRIVALRADMDALPIQEQNDVPYRSESAGKMHACGHDAHTTCLLGAATILKELQAELTGTVLLVFQPSEEKNPGGAKIMLDDGLFRDFQPEAIFGQHVFTPLPVGQLGFRPGAMMAAADELYITIRGKGGHAAAPQLAVDPIVATAHVILALQTVVSRTFPPDEPAVVTIGKVAGGTTTNIIPDSVELVGTFRSLDAGWRKKGHEAITRLVEQTAAAYGATAEVRIDLGYPPVRNTPALTTFAREAAERYVGAAQVKPVPLSMGAEDFAYYLEQLPGCFYRLGVRNDEAGLGQHGLHTARFDLDEAALPVGAGFFAYLAAEFLAHGPHVAPPEPEAAAAGNGQAV